MSTPTPTVLAECKEQKGRSEATQERLSAERRWAKARIFAVRPGGKYV